MARPVIMQELYEQAWTWIALNDEPQETNMDKVADSCCVRMASELFGIKPKDIAIRVINFRIKLEVKGEPQR